MKTLLTIFFLVILENGFAQSIGNTIPLIPQGNTMNLLNGYGSSALFNDVANISSINPAALDRYTNISLGFSYQTESKLNKSWIGDIGSERINKIIPQSFGFVYSLDDLKLGLSMYQKYNRAFVIGSIKKTTEESPDGTGELYTPEFKSTINNYSLSMAYTFNELFPEADLSVGFRMGLNYLHYYEKIMVLELDESLSSTDYSIGVVYTAKKDNNYLRFGLFYESELHYNKLTNYKVTNPPVVVIPGSVNNHIFINNVKIVANLPSTLRFDFDISTIENIKLLGSISNVFWSKIESNVQNQIEFSGSAVYFVSDTFSPSLGFFYTDRKQDEDYSEINKNMNVFFITAGMVLKYDNFNINLTLADSHLFSGEWRKQTIFKSNFSYNF